MTDATIVSMPGEMRPRACSGPSISLRSKKPTFSTKSILLRGRTLAFTPPADRKAGRNATSQQHRTMTILSPPPLPLREKARGE